MTQWAGNGWIREAILAALTATAHILVVLQRTATYLLPWIRDGSMMSAALLRMGHADEVREFIRWYAPHQRTDELCLCVEHRGDRWLVEHDSHGQLLATANHVG